MSRRARKAEYQSLSRTQQTVYALVVKGEDDWVIAERIELSRNAVRYHLARIKELLGIPAPPRRAILQHHAAMNGLRL